MNDQPMFFDGSAGQLFGVFHPTSSAPRFACLIAPPLGQEAVRCHKLLQKLATDLARKGIPTLRFDYTASGNSSAPQVWSLDNFREDLLLAAQQARQLSGTSRLSIVGIRLGASLALNSQMELEHLVAWDPIGNGPKYLGELDQLHQAVQSSPLYYRRRPKARRDSDAERVGHPLSTEFRRSLSTFDLSVTVRSQRVTWLEVERTAAGIGPEICPPERQTEFDSHLFHQPRCNWNDVDQLEKVFLGQPIARRIFNALTEANR